MGYLEYETAVAVKHMGKAHKKQESEEDPPEDLPAPPCPDPVVKPDDVQQDFYWCVFK